MCPSSARRRWCPTPEQLRILQELYQKGLTNPNSSQIQKITAHLSNFGQIQGKNVFYWFQNHKARDRLNIRKKFANQLHQHLYGLHPYQCDSSSAFHHVFTCASAHNHFPQGSGAREDTTMAADLSKDNLIRVYGHNLMMMTDVGPIFPCCRNRSPETLELFPLTSSSCVKDQETNAA